MRIREPIVAGRFYPETPDSCRSDLDRLLGLLTGEPRTGPVDTVGGHLRRAVDRPVGGLVPHAGWLYSGQIAAKVFGAIAASRSPKVVVLLGGVHRRRGREAALFGSGRWETPIGPVEIDDRLADRILGYTNLIVDDPYAHEEEHSIEVQMPFVKHLFPHAKVVPIMVPPVKTACEVGDAVGRTLVAYGYDAVVVGTTDLTHYGPDYGFVPKGVGEAANRWAKEENDRRFIDLLCTLQTDKLVPEALQNKNACSSGAAAATTAAVAALGSTKGVLLDHTSSSDVARETGQEVPDQSVGYAGILFS